MIVRSAILWRCRWYAVRNAVPRLPMVDIFNAVGLVGFFIGCFYAAEIAERFFK